MNIETDVIDIVAGIIQVPAASLNANTSMDDVKGWDSMHHMMILTSIQERFGIEFPEDDIFDLVSIRSLVDEVAKLKA